MNNDIKKAGRPKGPAKVGFYRRLRPEWANRCSQLIAAMEDCSEEELGGITSEVLRLIKHRELANAEGGSWRMEIPSEAIKGRREPEIPAFTEASTAKEAQEKPYEEIEDLKHQIALLLEDIQTHTDTIIRLENELEEARLMSYDEKMAYLVDRIKKAEEQIKRNLDQ